jgi:hypothetical protein
MPRGVYKRKPRTRAYKMRRVPDKPVNLNFAPTPKIYFVKDSGFGRYRIGRSDWPGDCFTVVPTPDFETFQRIYQSLGMPLVDLTDDDDNSQWEKLKEGVE